MAKFGLDWKNYRLRYILVALERKTWDSFVSADGESATLCVIVQTTSSRLCLSTHYPSIGSPGCSSSVVYMKEQQALVLHTHHTPEHQHLHRKDQEHPYHRRSCQQLP